MNPAKKLLDLLKQPEINGEEFLKQFVLFLVDTAEELEKDTADGKISFSEWWELRDNAKTLFQLFASAPKAIDIIGSVDSDELIALATDELNMDNDEIEVKIEKGFAFVIAGMDFAATFARK